MPVAFVLKDQKGNDIVRYCNDLSHKIMLHADKIAPINNTIRIKIEKSERKLSRKIRKRTLTLSFNFSPPLRVTDNPTFFRQKCNFPDAEFPACCVAHDARRVGRQIPEIVLASYCSLFGENT
ncbi:hypothetical protein ALC57_16770 [Trachymyrmex cornetzi]|uniref:Uncharacterized protein n=1 Tax=Trachymyrmex cornetzi TaxID=471704 RepID=A0A151IUQ4_9HYME|nr:hypothetical protein ALC57_16770 [Trachymyrmex cornetzi]